MPPTILRRHAALGAFGALPLLAAATALAEDQADDDIEEVVVRVHPLSGDGLAESALVLEGAELERDVAASLGDTLARQTGIHSASFGPAASRPVVHGMAGPRVRIMEDRIDVMDASINSVDHAVTVEPFLAERIEVVKGPSTLLFGSGAIGGVVDVQTGRIPQQAPDRVSGRVALRAADNGDADNAAFRLDGGGGAFAWHLDGFSRSAGDYDIPGYAESARMRAAEEAEHEHDEHDDHEEDHEHEEEPFGALPGSHADGRGGAFGLSWIGERGFIGFAASRLDYDYGLVDGHQHHDEHGEEGEHEDEHHEEEAHHEEDGPVLALEQTKFDFEATLADPFAAFSALNVRVGRNDYMHVEFEPEDEGGMGIAVDSFETRIELTRDAAGGMRSAIGAQFGARDFSAMGGEAFLPPVKTTSLGVFWAGERELARFDLETGVRLERVEHDPTRDRGADFTAFSASLGIVAPLGDAQLGVHGSYSSRAPVAEELYSNGAHLVTRSLLIGDPGLERETALSIAATISWRGERASLEATAYATAFRDHILQFATGEVEDELPVLRFGQEDTVYRGLDCELDVTIAEFDGGSIAANAMFDAVAAAIDTTGNDRVPRLPPRRAGAGLGAEYRALSAELDVLRVFEQSDTAAMELPTDAYTDVRVRIALDFDVGGIAGRVFVHGRNLTDEEQRHHASFVKDLAPLPGRTWEVGLRAAF